MTLAILYSSISSLTTSDHGFGVDDAVWAVLKKSRNTSLSVVLFAGGLPLLVAAVSESSAGFWLVPCPEACVYKRQGHTKHLFKVMKRHM